MSLEQKIEELVASNTKLAAVIRELTVALSTKPDTAVGLTATQYKVADPQPAPAVTTTQTAVDQAAAAAPQPSAAQAEVVSAPATASPSNDDVAPTYTLQQCREATMGYIGSDPARMASVSEILAGFGVPNLSTLNPELYTAFMAKLTEVQALAAA